MQAKNYERIPQSVEDVGRAVLDAAFKVHTTLGPGLLESVYQTCTACEITQSGLLAPTEVSLPVVYKEVQLDAGLRLDMLVENCVIVEFKAVEEMHPVYTAQVISYLKMTGLRLGYLINFNVVHLKDGIRRIAV
jgi:GxxExxY protein